MKIDWNPINDFIPLKSEILLKPIFVYSEISLYFARLVEELRKKPAPSLVKMRILTGLRKLPLLKPPVVDVASIPFQNLWKIPPSMIFIFFEILD